MYFTDSVAVGEIRTTRDGFAVIDANIARTGIQVYAGHEVGRPEFSTVRVYRPAEEVFTHDAMMSFAHRTVTNDHPKSLVSSQNWKEVAVGMTGDSVARSGDHLRVPFSLMDHRAIADMNAGKKELSCGYVCDLDFVSGEAPDGGGAFDAIQRNIRGNHLALVKAGRAGKSCRIGDSWADPDPAEPAPTPSPERQPTMATKTIQFDGISIETTDQGAQAIDRLQGYLRDARTQVETKDAEIARLTGTHTTAMQAKDGQLAALESGHRNALAAKDGELAALNATHTAALATKDGELAALRSEMTPEALEARVAERSRVLDAARKVLGDGVDLKGKPEADVRRLVVTKKLGDTAVAGKEQAFIDAAFETLSLTAPAHDPLRRALAGATLVPAARLPVGDGATADQASADAAYEEMRTHQAEGWRQPVPTR